ncbi:MAG: hypothetical protein KF873_23540 [Gemmataceae bacterium]|nr:hypothetical protein [Gemmataceae bacterium]
MGDGLGFDILSFEEFDYSERSVEVKTTGGEVLPFLRHRQRSPLLRGYS